VRAFTIAAAAGLALVSSATMAANLGVSPSYGGRAYIGGPMDDGPYYITPWGESAYIECGRPKVPYWEDSPGPRPNSIFFGPVGYRCIRGTYAYDPFYPPRCRTAFVREGDRWVRVRHCS
jgi:hypothetical protein